jgi:hypothetical protein
VEKSGEKEKFFSIFLGNVRSGIYKTINEINKL